MSTCSSADQIHQESGLCFGVYDTSSTLAWSAKDTNNAVDKCETIGGLAFVNSASKSDFLTSSTIFTGLRYVHHAMF